MKEEMDERRNFHSFENRNNSVEWKKKRTIRIKDIFESKSIREGKISSTLQEWWAKIRSTVICKYVNSVGVWSQTWEAVISLSIVSTISVKPPEISLYR